MPSCVSESSYNILFICALVVIVLMLLSSAYFYDKFNKAETDRLTSKDTKVAKTMSMLSLVISVIGIAILFALFFGFKKRLTGVQVKVGSPIKVESPTSWVPDVAYEN